MKRLLIALALAALAPVLAVAQFADTGQVNNEYDRSDGFIMGWATGVVDYEVGLLDHAQPELGYADYGMATDVLGASGTPFSLGDAGWITVTFDTAVMNGPGDDFVVFENGFAYNGVFMELGFVEVSTNGVDFARLPALCRRTTQPGPWDSSDPADFYNLAGNHVGGTGFDLEDLVVAGDPLVAAGTVNLNHIEYVRVVDVIGDIVGGTTDYLGRPVADPYPTTSASCGMDLTGVGVINRGVVPIESVTWGGLKALYAR